jgi:hypothetical protein
MHMPQVITFLHLPLAVCVCVCVCVNVRVVCVCACMMVGLGWQVSGLWGNLSELSSNEV